MMELRLYVIMVRGCDCHQSTVLSEILIESCCRSVSYRFRCVSKLIQSPWSDTLRILLFQDVLEPSNEYNRFSGIFGVAPCRKTQ